MSLLNEGALAQRLQRLVTGGAGAPTHHERTTTIYADATTGGSGTWTVLSGSGTATGLTVSTPVTITIDHRTQGTLVETPEPILEFLVPVGSTWVVSTDPVIVGGVTLTAGEGFAIVLTPGATSVAYTWRRAGFIA